MTDRGQTAAQQLLGHRNLFGTQCRQHGVAVDGRSRCDRSLASGRPAVALSGPSIAGTARTGAPARTIRTAGTTTAAAGTTTGTGAAATAAGTTAAGTATGAISTVTATARPAIIAVVSVLVTPPGSLA